MENGWMERHDRNTGIASMALKINDHVVSVLLDLIFLSLRAL